jgi:hypothetical protein
VNLSGGGYGSSLYPDPGHPNLFYGLEDRGPHVTAADGKPDGTFYVSDEYGPFITHFNRNGRQISRLSPLDGGKEIVISNDSDFGIAGVTNAAPPWQLEPKISPTTGKQDDG